LAICSRNRSVAVIVFHDRDRLKPHWDNEEARGMEAEEATEKAKRSGKRRRSERCRKE
jgi:hypothetical protein